MPQNPPFFDADLEPAGLTGGDLEHLIHFGLGAALARPSLGPRAAAGAELLATWAAFIEREPARLAAAGLATFTALGIPPASLPEKDLEAALHGLTSLLDRCGGVAVGPVGLGSGHPTEEHALRRQLEVAHEINRPLWVQLPAPASRASLRRLLDVLAEGGAEPARVLVEGPGRQAFRILRECGYWVALRPQPHRLSVQAAAELVNRHGSEGVLLASGAGGGHGDLLALPKALAAMEDLKLPPSVLRRVSTENAAAFFRLEL